MRQSMKQILMTRSSDGMIQSHYEAMRVGGRLSDVELGEMESIAPSSIRRMPHKSLR
ncbi:hypothetical protein NV379_15710 [Paenibacillus sp. N1-5-1-14]|uniref:hypothetical protein n=1 Tax=Paenibacillus radicibacter TaxID=2972488 RepID=UPI002159AB96|nr:hypothetical protein [Paenibacillus radicibacter]MCR8644099.1 hypothetical protein [Paenibacillus radicibacter]